MSDEMHDTSLSLHSFSIPVEGISLSKATANDDAEWVIEGLASTPSRDQQNEVVLVKGLDLSYLEQGRGTFNWNHRGDADPSSIVGVITHCERTNDHQLLVKGKLLKSLPKAKHVYQLMKALATDCPDRQMGMSIEGKVLARNGNTIVKAWVKAVALTLDPVNKDTWVTFAKSMDGMEWAAPGSEPLVDAPVELLESAVLKSLSVGATTMGSATGGSILTPESLEKKPHSLESEHDQTPEERLRNRKKAPVPSRSLGHPEPAKPEKPLVYTRSRPESTSGMDHPEPAKPEKPLVSMGKTQKRNEKMNKSYSFDEAVTLLQRMAPHMSDSLIKHIVSHTFRSKGQE